MRVCTLAGEIRVCAAPKLVRSEVRLSGSMGRRAMLAEDMAGPGAAGKELPVQPALAFRGVWNRRGQWPIEEACAVPLSDSVVPARMERERQRLEQMGVFEAQARANGFRRIAGADEAGRGPLAGPIVAAAVVLAGPLPGLNDSKQLTPARRAQLFNELALGGHTIAQAVIEPAEIDRLGIQTANLRAMALAVEGLQPAADYVLVDGFALPGCAVPHLRLVKGDQRSASIAAASIVAKVVRDRLMEDWDRRYPEYGFARHKGYGTAQHLEALRKLGPCPIHRRCFAPVAELPDTANLFDG